jgi:probable phosphomutase (TIGR03848 family)
MLLLLVRHAVTAATGSRLSGWLPGFHLSEEGVRQAEAVAARLAGLPVKAIYSSPLERCRETAELIAAHHRPGVTVMDELGEIRYGDWQGRSFKTLYRTKAWVELQQRPADFRFPNGETIREAQTRGVGAIEALRPKHKADLVVVASHADMIRLILAAYLGLSLDLYQRMSIAPASVTALLLGDRIPHLLKLGDTGTLDDLKLRLAKGPTDTARRKPAGAKAAGAASADGRSPEAYGGGPKPADGARAKPGASRRVKTAAPNPSQTGNGSRKRTTAR